MPDVRLCIVCGARATVARRNFVPDGFERGVNPKTGAPMNFAKFKPTAGKWYCRRHAPAPVIDFNKECREAAAQRKGLL